MAALLPARAIRIRVWGFKLVRLKPPASFDCACSQLQQESAFNRRSRERSAQIEVSYLCARFFHHRWIRFTRKPKTEVGNT